MSVRVGCQHGNVYYVTYTVCVFSEKSLAYYIFLPGRHFLKYFYAMRTKTVLILILIMDVFSSLFEK